MDLRITAFFFALCLLGGGCVPVVELRPTHIEGLHEHRAVIVKRSAQYDTPGSGIPCGFSAYRCPYPDLPALCAIYNVPTCHGTDFINVDIGR